MKTTYRERVPELWLALAPALFVIRGLVGDHYHRSLSSPGRDGFVFYVMPATNVALPAVGVVVAVLLGRWWARRASPVGSARSWAKRAVWYVAVQTAILIALFIVAFLYVLARLLMGFGFP